MNMSPETTRCGMHDDINARLGKMEGVAEATKVFQVETHVSIEKLHDRINGLKGCMNDIKIETIQAVNKNKLDTVKAVNRANLKLAAIIAPLSGTLVALAQHFIK